MNNYPTCWIRYIGKVLDKSFDHLNVEEIKKSIGLDAYARIKRDYRNSDYKKNLDFNVMAKILANDIKTEGYKIMVSTSRPINSNEYPNLKNNTALWLHKNNFQYDILIEKSHELDQLNLYHSIAFHIDDEYKYCQQFANKGVPSFIVNSSIRDGHKLITTIDSLEHLKSIWRDYV